MGTLILFGVAILIIYGTLNEWDRYSQPEKFADQFEYSEKRFRRRMVISGDLLLILFLLGIRELVEAQVGRSYWLLAYVGFILILILYLMLLLLADIMETSRQARQEQAKMLDLSSQQLNILIEEELKKVKAMEQGGEEAKVAEPETSDDEQKTPARETEDETRDKKSD